MRILFMLLMILFSSLPANAALVQLKNGQSVEGVITERSKENIKMDVQGVSMTYFLDEISSIDGQPAVLTSSATPTTATPPNKKELILKFIDAFGTRRALEANFAAMLEQMPAEQAEKFRKAVKIDEIIERLIPLYDKHFTVEELQACIDFYTSSNGAKLIAIVPVLMEESMGISAKYLEEKLPADKVQ
jgi:hypothetical protein